MNSITKDISIDLIDDPEIAMRSDVHDPDIEELAQSIKEHGLLEALVVRPKGTRFELIAGHRRLTACKIISKILIPCTIRKATDNEALILRIQENSHRLDVNPVDEAVYMQKMLNQLSCTVPELSKLMKRSESVIYNRLAILDFPDYLIEVVGDKKVSVAAAIILMKITNEEYRQSLIEIAAKDGISADTADRWWQMWKLNLLPTIPTAENLEVATNENAPPAAAVQCAKCLQSGLVKDSMTVWIHRECPELAS